MVITGSSNKGDWSEFYALLFLIGKRALYCTDKNLNKLHNTYFPINRAIRTEDQNTIVQYILENNDKVQIYVGDNLVKTMNSREFVEEAQYLYDHLINSSGRTIDIPRSRSFLKQIYLNRLGMPNNEVSDLKLDLHDIYTGMNQLMGFSIKSYIGGPPTLLNASKSTNFIYEIEGIDDSKMDYINSIRNPNKIQKRIKCIFDSEGVLRYSDMYSETFKDNLTMIDGDMERLLSELILDSYRTNVIQCTDLLDHIADINPLNYKRKEIYVYKFKQFLIAKALGMNPDTLWDGLDNANGGYIVVKENGDVLAYYIYNRNELEQYLFENTKLERASTSRHDYASIYKHAGRYYINLNLQIRFI